MQTKKFHLSDILSITTGRLVSTRHIDGVYDILSFMTNDSIFTHQIPRATNECKPWLFRWFPALKGVDESSLEIPEHAKTNAQRRFIIDDWLNGLIAEHGEHLEIQQIPMDDHAQIDPIEELEQKLGKGRVIKVNMPMGEEEEMKPWEEDPDVWKETMPDDED